MTGQPATAEELTKANQRADKKMNNEEVPEDIKNHPLTKESLKDGGTEEKSRDEKLEELREFKENNQDLYDGLEEAVAEAKEDDTEMHVTEDGETTTYTRDEWENERGTRARTWDRLERNGGMFVRVADWFTDTDVRKVKTGRGFFGHKVGETDKALKFEIGANEGHTADVETVWVPKSAVRTHELKE